MKPREGKHAPNPKGFPGGGNRPRGGLLHPSGGLPGSSVFTCEVRVFRGAPAMRGPLLSPQVATGLLAAGRVQLATGLQPSPRASATSGCSAFSRHPRSGAPGLSSASQPLGRSSPRASVSEGSFGTIDKGIVPLGVMITEAMEILEIENRPQRSSLGRCPQPSLQRRVPAASRSLDKYALVYNASRRRSPWALQCSSAPGPLKPQGFSLSAHGRATCRSTTPVLQRAEKPQAPWRRVFSTETMKVL